MALRKRSFTVAKLGNTGGLKGLTGFKGPAGRNEITNPIVVAPDTPLEPVPLLIEGTWEQQMILKIAGSNLAESVKKALVDQLTKGEGKTKKEEEDEKEKKQRQRIEDAEKAVKEAKGGLAIAKAKAELEGAVMDYLP